MTLAIAPEVPLQDAALEHRAFVRARLQRLGVPATDLDDATQDVFEILVRRLDAFDPTRGSPRQCLSGIARRVATKYRRQPTDEPLEVSATSAPETPSDPERALARAQAWAVLEQFLDRLDHDRWTVFVLSELEGLSGPEIADELSINVNTVYARLRSARQELARVLGREHARQRGPIGWLFGMLALRRRTAVLGASIGGTVVLAVGLTATLHSCGSLESEHQRPAQTHAVTAPTQDPPAPRVATRAPGSTAETPEPRPPVAAAPPLTATATDPPPWVALPRSTSYTDAYTVERRGRSRIQGSELELELTYEADRPAEAFAAHLELDGFTLTEGTEAWSVDLVPDRPRTIRVVLRAHQQGVVRAAIHTGLGRPELDEEASRGSVSLPFEFDGAVLARCVPGKCVRRATMEDADLSGAMVDVRLRNDCTSPIEVAMFAGPPEHAPPRRAPRRSMEPGETIEARVDANTKFYKDGLTASLEQGQLAVFSGERCSMVSTSSAQP